MSYLCRVFWEDSKMFTVYDITRSALKKHLKKECDGLDIRKVDGILKYLEELNKLNTKGFKP